MRINLTVNGIELSAEIEPTDNLLTVLRDHLELRGSKNACEQGECGSCSVLIDGRLACSCLILGTQAQGHEVTTIEGLASEQVQAIQEAFVAHGAVQCGFCTPGLIVATYALLDRRNSAPSDEEICEALSGNLCRCTGYGAVLRAVKAVTSQ